MVSHAVMLSDQLVTELIPLARREDKAIEEVVNEAVQRYIWEAREQQIDRELAAYHAQHAQLKQRYLGQYIALRQGKVVGHGADRKALSREMRRLYGNEVILITPVTESPDREWEFRSPRFACGEA